MSKATWMLLGITIGFVCGLLASSSIKIQIESGHVLAIALSAITAYMVKVVWKD